MTPFRIPIIGLVLLLSSPCHATQWVVDHTKSSLGFTVLWSGESFTARFRTWDAKIAFDPSDLTHARISVSVDLASEASDTPDNDDGLKGPEGFWVERYRTARFESTAVTASGPNAYTARGSLNLHGLTRPVVLSFTLSVAGNSAHAVGRGQVIRTDFGLGTGEWAGTTPLAHEVDIHFDIAATKSR